MAAPHRPGRATVWQNKKPGQSTGPHLAAFSLHGKPTVVNAERGGSGRPMAAGCRPGLFDGSKKPFPSAFAPLARGFAHGYGPRRFRPGLTSQKHRGEVAEWSIAPHSKCGILARVSGVRIPPSPPLSCSEPEMRLPLGAFFFLFQRRLAETPEPRRLAPRRISVSEQPSVSNRPNLVRPGSAS